MVLEDAGCMWTRLGWAGGCGGELAFVSVRWVRRAKVPGIASPQPRHPLFPPDSRPPHLGTLAAPRGYPVPVALTPMQSMLKLA